MLRRRQSPLFFLVIAASIATYACADGDDFKNDSKNGGEDKARELGEQGAGICAAASSWKTACTSATNQCDETIVGACTDVTSLLNASILESAKTCLDGADKCSASPGKCLSKAVTSAKATAAHTKLAKGFCGCLPAGADACIAEIDKGEGAAKVALTVALPLSDGVADAITEACTTTIGCSATFSACAQGVITKKIAEKLSADAAGCVAKSILSAAKDTGGETGPASPGEASSCATKKTCEDYPGKCGDQDDGCGGQVHCAACPTSCKPKTCAELGKTCGNYTDGCGGTANCGECPATSCTSASSTMSRATNLGDATDAPNTTKVEANLTVADGAENWFKMRVTDSGFGGNPQIDASVSRTSLEVSVFHQCDSKPNYSTCVTDDGLSIADANAGAGCVTRGKSSLATECSGIDESGTTYIRVRKLASDGQCTAYALTVDVF